MTRASLLPTLVLVLVILNSCAQVAPSQPSAPTAGVPVSTTVPKPTASAASASKPAAPTVPASGQAAPKPSAAAAKPTTSPAPAGAAATSAARPAAQASPKPNGGSSAQGSPPAVVATSAAALPAVVAPTAPAQASPKPNGAAPKPAEAATKPSGAAAKPADALGVAASAGSAAAVTTGPDAEATALCGQGAILSTRASQAAGRQATIAIAKVEASYQPNVRGQPTFLNDAPYPNHGFTAVIWGTDRRNFDPAPTSWQGKALCVTGTVEVYQQKPQITVNAASQLRAAR